MRGWCGTSLVLSSIPLGGQGRGRWSCVRFQTCGRERGRLADTIPESSCRHLKVQLRKRTESCELFHQPGSTRSVLCLHTSMLTVHLKLSMHHVRVIKRLGKLSSTDKAFRAASRLLLLAVASHISHFLLGFSAGVCACEHLFVHVHTTCSLTNQMLGT